MRIKIHKTEHCFFTLAICLSVCALLPGCTVNKVSLLARQSASEPVKASEVKFYPRFNAVKEPCRVEG